jgi:hypothetical protein
MELQIAQALYDQSLCIFPDCTAVSASIPVKQTTNLHQHIRCYTEHNTPKANAYKQRLIGNLTYKYLSKRKFVFISPFNTFSQVKAYSIIENDVPVSLPSSILSTEAQNEYQRAQDLYNRSLCIFPDCDSLAARIPVTTKSNLYRHIRQFHNTHEENSYKLRLIGKLSYKWRATRRLVSSTHRLLCLGQCKCFHRG